MFKGEKKELKMFWRALEARRRRGKVEKLRRCNSFGSWGEILKLNKISVKRKRLRDFKIYRVNMFQCVYVSELPQREAAGCYPTSSSFVLQHKTVKDGDSTVINLEQPVYLASPRYLQDISKISPRYLQDIPKISPNIPQIFPRYP